MAEVAFEDVRRIVLGVLFVVAFGWMGAQILPGQPEPQQMAVTVSAAG
ncbi:MAG: hypothetical protein ACM33T_04630 [Solirubrobacterales bacterium]